MGKAGPPQGIRNSALGRDEEEPRDDSPGERIGGGIASMEAGVPRFVTRRIHFSRMRGADLGTPQSP
jgi:hypothetical protein